MTFRELKIGCQFEFADPVEFSIGRIFVKVSPRQYVERGSGGVDGGQYRPVYKIGSSSVEVKEVPENPVTLRRLPTGRYRVSTPGGVKSYGTTLRKAQAQRRILQAADNPKGTPFADGRKRGYADGAGHDLSGFADEQSVIDYMEATHSDRKPPYDWSMDRGQTSNWEDGYHLGYVRAWREQRQGIKYRKNPADIDAPAPPLYRLNFLELECDKRKMRKYPAFPVQILPSADSTIELRFWGSAKYDVHIAFPGFKPLSFGYIKIREINYQICYAKECHHLRHPFEKAHVVLALDGLHADRVIMKAFPDLEGFPHLPEDWMYYQFVN